jgi:transposase
MPKNHTPAAPHEMRFRWYRQVEEYGKTVEEVCDVFGISRKTYYKWYKKDHGLGSNQYKNRGVHPHAKITGRVAVMLVETKEKYNYGPAKMKLHLKEYAKVDVSTTAIYKFMKKKRLIRKPRKTQTWYAPMKHPFKATKPGENVQLDVKFVPGRGGEWKYQYRFIDVVTDLQYAVDMDWKDAQTTIRAFHGAERSFPFPILGIQTDNGGEFRGVFHEYLLRRDITHRYIPKRSAPWNGKVERANRSVDDEFYLNITKPWKTLWQYTRWYNHGRYHLGKNQTGLTPYQKFLALTR